jgi:hypothetical protein
MGDQEVRRLRLAARRPDHGRSHRKGHRDGAALRESGAVRPARSVTRAQSRVELPVWQDVSVLRRRPIRPTVIPAQAGIQTR